MIPISDDNPTLRPPLATYVLIGMNVVVWGVVQGFGLAEPMAHSLCQYGLIPGNLLSAIPSGTPVSVGDGWVCQLSGEGHASTLITSMFMHGSWLHLLGNMLFLWIFGDNVEDVMGPGRFFVFYLLCGLAAAAAQIVQDPSSTVPMVGASGAIGGVMGAYAILFPRARVHLLIILVFYVTTVSVPAYLMLGYWFLLQLLSGVGSLGSGSGGVAFWAHVGGFVTGIASVMVFKRQDLIDARAHLASRRSARHSWL